MASGHAVRLAPRVPAWLAGVIGLVLVVVSGSPQRPGTRWQPRRSCGARRAAGPGEPTEPPTTEDGRGLGDDGGWLGYVVAGSCCSRCVVFVVTVVVLVIRMFAGRENGLLRRRVLEPEEIDSC